MLSAPWLASATANGDDEPTPSYRPRAIRATAIPDTADRAERIRQGDHAEFTAFVEEQYERAVRVAWAVLRSHDLARDVAQDVFIRLWERRAELDAQQLNTAYIVVAAHRRALDEIKRHRVRERHADAIRLNINDEPASIAPDSTIEDPDVTTRRTVVSVVQRELKALPARWQLVLRLRLREELAVPEIATVLGISTNAAHQLLHRAIRELRRRVDVGMSSGPGGEPSA